MQHELQAARGYLLEPLQVAHNTVHFRHDLLTARSSATEAIDWRGKVTPDFSKYRYVRGFKCSFFKVEHFISRYHNTVTLN